MVEAAARRGRLPELAKYEALEEIGHGGMATVYRARDRRLGREVALKVIHPHLQNSAEVRSRFFAEAKAVAKLRHPNIVEVYDVSEATEPDQYLVVELVRGATLRQLWQRSGPMPPEVAAAIALELLSALGHANGSGVVHRDVKPENVLIEHQSLVSDRVSDRATDGVADRPTDRAADATDPAKSARVAVKLTDFGIAKLLDAQGVTSTGQVLGSPAHMAPEQIEGGDVDARADVFGLGVLLYESMVGRLPFEGNNPAQVLRRVLEGEYPAAFTVRPIVGARWSKILDGALAHAPADRFASAGAMSEAIARELDRLGFTAPLRDLASWLDDSAAYELAYKARIVERLCACGDEARRQRDALGAAADYNRALAYSPDDPQLMRIVTGLYRAEVRARDMRRGAYAVTMVVGVGAAAWAGQHFLGPSWSHAHSPADGAVTANAMKAPSIDPTAAASPPAVSNLPVSPPLNLPVNVGAPGTSAAVVNPSAPAAEHATSTRSHDGHVAPKNVDRTITLDLKPPMGVDLSLDGQAARGVTTGDVLTVDAGTHSLLFSCSVCASAEVALAPGEKNERIVVSVPVRPATLVVEGSAAKTYQIAQHPELTVRAGTNTIALKSAFEHVSIKEIESGTTVSVRLEAGKSVRASFE